jgi:hypothetical protein
MTRLSDSADARVPVSDEREIETLPGITYHAWKPLKTQGYHTVGDIRDMSLDVLLTMVRPLSAFNLLKAIGRGAEYEARFGPETLMVDGTEVKIGVVRTLMTLTATARYFKFESPEQLQAALEAGVRQDPETGEIIPFTFEDIARYRMETNKRKDTEALERINRDAGGTSSMEVARFMQRVGERMKEYAKDYDTSQWTAADIHTLEWLVYNELRLENLQSAQATAISGTQIAEQANKARSDEIVRLWDVIQKMRNELQISLKARTEAQNKTEAQAVITDLASKGKNLIAQRASVLQHCGTLQGIFLPNFPAHIVDKSISVRCAVCGADIEWTLVTPSMLELYTEAGSFVPQDAPKGILERR